MAAVGLIFDIHATVSGRARLFQNLRNASLSRRSVTCAAATKKVFIDGEAGTTGLQVRERLAAREDIAWTLQTLSPQISALSHLWSTEFRAARLVDAGSEEFRASVPWEVDAFVAHQSATREASKSALWERWTAETAAVFRADPPVCVNADSDAYYDAVRRRVGDFRSNRNS